MEYNVEDILYELEDMKCEYELDGVELTPEDAMMVITELECGKTKDQAIDDVLSGIRETLDWEWL